MKNKYPTWRDSLAGTEQWHRWYAFATKHHLFDVDESQECDMMSPEHAKAFMAFVEGGCNRPAIIDVLKKERKLHKITQEEMAKALGISRASYIAVEQGKRKLYLHEAEIINKLFAFNN